jgi:hypothetical protein
VPGTDSDSSLDDDNWRNVGLRVAEDVAVLVAFVDDLMAGNAKAEERSIESAAPTITVAIDVILILEYIWIGLAWLG